MVGFIKKFSLLFIILGAILLFYFTGLSEWLNLETFKLYQDRIVAGIEQDRFFFLGSFILFYALLVTLSLPFASILTIMGGFLFGLGWGLFGVVTGASLGAVILFIAARTAFSDLLLEKAGPWIKKFEQGFKKDAVGYLLFLRLVPVFPFFIVNLVPAFLGVRLSVFALTTIIGIIPGSFVYVLAGVGISSVDNLSPSGILTPQMIAALAALGILALVPVIYRRKARK